MSHPQSSQIWKYSAGAFSVLGTVLPSVVNVLLERISSERQKGG